MDQELIPLDITKITIFDEFEATLVELEESNKKTVFDYDDPQGLKDAKKHVGKVTTTITAVENIRVEKKKPYWDYGKALDAKAKGLTARLEVVRQVHAKPIRIRKKQNEERIQKHNANATAFFNFRYFDTDCDSEEYEKELELIEKTPVGDSWEEFKHLAVANREEAITELKQIIVVKKNHEKEQAELFQLRQQAIERNKADEEARIAAEARSKAEAKAAQDAENLRQENIRKEREEHNARVLAEREQDEARERAAQEREEKQCREANERRLEIEAANRATAEAEERAANAERLAKEKFEREAKEKEEKERKEKEAREADNKHRECINTDVRRAIYAAIPEGFGSEQCDDISNAILQSIVDGEIPHTSIKY